MANGANPGAAPGFAAPGVPAGAPGSAPGAAMASGPGGAAQIPQVTPGSAEEALLKFCMAMADSNLTEAGRYISPKAKGLLSQIRDGSLSDEKIDSLKNSFSLQGLTKRDGRPPGGTGKTITLANNINETLTFTLMKEDDVYLLRDFKITKVSETEANRRKLLYGR